MNCIRKSLLYRPGRGRRYSGLRGDQGRDRRRRNGGARSRRITSREHVIALEPRGKGIMGVTLRYPYEVRDEKEYFNEIPSEKVTKDMLDLASHIVQTKTGHFNPKKFEDRYEDALKELLRKKENGEKIEAPREREPGGSRLTSWMHCAGAPRASKPQRGHAYVVLAPRETRKRRRERLDTARPVEFSVSGHSQAQSDVR